MSVGPSPSAYGDAFADVYDDWYGEISDVDATVVALVQLAGGRRVLELGVGTGRIAIPLAAAGADVDAVDASPAMLAALVAKPGAVRLGVILADMAALPVRGPYGVVFATFNTFFNLTTEAAQRRCLARVADVLSPHGKFAVEAFVPSAEPAEPDHGRAERPDGAGGTIVTASVRDPTDQTVRGEHIHTAADGVVTRRPWTIRYLSPVQLDDMCADAGLGLAHRWRDWSGEPFDPDGDRHVSVYVERT